MGTNNKENKKAFIYTRVSTSIQVEGYSLEAQEESIRKYCKYNDITIEHHYSDAGKSGTKIKGRTEFQNMMQDIQDGADVQYVIVFKLSRFGRNTADVLNSVQILQDYGVNLICVEDSIDTSQPSGKFVVTVLAAVAEIDRENIIAQTKAGREQKASEGGWNGGHSPYGYNLINGELQVDEEEAVLIKEIFSLYTEQEYSMAGIAKRLNLIGRTKNVRGNAKLESFSAGFVKSILDNPVYVGKIAYGRRRVKPRKGGHRNETHVVRQKEYSLYDGIHEAIISEETWEATRKKRAETGHKREAAHTTNHIHLLSGLLKCPVCGAGLYGNKSRKKKSDGTTYKTFYYYACKHRISDVYGHKCTFTKQLNEEQVNKEVLDVVAKVINEDMLRDRLISWLGFGKDDEKLRASIEELNVSIENKKKHLVNLEKQMDAMNITSEESQERYDRLLQRSAEFEKDIAALRKERTNLEVQVGTLDHKAYKALEKKRMSAEEYIDAYKALLPHINAEPRDRDFLRSIIDRIDIYEERQMNEEPVKEDKDAKQELLKRDKEATKNIFAETGDLELGMIFAEYEGVEFDEKPAKGRLIKSIRFKVPIEVDEITRQEIRDLGFELTTESLDNESKGECIVLMSAAFFKENR